MKLSLFKPIPSDAPLMRPDSIAVYKNGGDLSDTQAWRVIRDAAPQNKKKTTFVIERDKQGRFLTQVQIGDASFADLALAEAALVTGEPKQAFEEKAERKETRAKGNRELRVTTPLVILLMGGMSYGYLQGLKEYKTTQTTKSDKSVGITGIKSIDAFGASFSLLMTFALAAAWGMVLKNTKKFNENARLAIAESDEMRSDLLKQIRVNMETQSATTAPPIETPKND